MANRRRRVSLPAWTNHVADTEVAVELSFLLSHSITNDKIAVEDSRCHFLLVRDMHDIFIKRHASMRHAYWSEHNFYEQLLAVYEAFLECAQLEPTWINTKFHAMLGTEHVQHLFKRYPYIVEMHQAAANGNSKPEKK